MKLTVIIPTRGRADLLRLTVGCTLANMSREDTTLLIAADSDDEETLGVLGLLPKDKRILISVEPREDTRGEKADRALAAAPADIYLQGADYAPVVTWGFDQKIIDAVVWPDKIGVVYAAMCDELVPTLQAPTAKFVEKMGYTYSHDYPFWFIDHEMADVAWQMGRINFADVDVDVSRRPEKTLRLRDLDFWTRYFDIIMRYEVRPKVNEIVKSVDFEAPDWLKTQLCTWSPLLEKRSMMRNARVRATAAQCEQARGESEPPDEGYLRAKARAEQKVAALMKGRV